MHSAAAQDAIITVVTELHEHEIALQCVKVVIGTYGKSTPWRAE
jgi:hypothetical protein